MLPGHPEPAVSCLARRQFITLVGVGRLTSRRKGFQMTISVNAGARLDRLPISSFHCRIFALVGAGMFFDGYDLYVAGGVLAATIQTNFSTLPQNLQFLSLTFARNPLLRNQLILSDKC